MTETKPEPEAEPVSASTHAPEPEQKLESPSSVVMSGDYYVQLASVQDSTRADSEWKKLQSKYGAILSGYEYRVETANLAKGTYYRIQAGPVTKDQANKTCNAIKAKTPGGCLVKKK